MGVPVKLPCTLPPGTPTLSAREEICVWAATRLTSVEGGTQGDRYSRCRCMPSSSEQVLAIATASTIGHEAFICGLLAAEGLLTNSSRYDQLVGHLDLPSQRHAVCTCARLCVVVQSCPEATAADCERDSTDVIVSLKRVDRLRSRPFHTDPPVRQPILNFEYMYGKVTHIVYLQIQCKNMVKVLVLQG
jgi:hypothetical protein